MKHFCAFFLTTFLFVSPLWSGLVYEKQIEKQRAEATRHQATKYNSPFNAVGKIKNTKKLTASYGTGSLITLQGRLAILTAGHVIEKAQKLTFTLEIQGTKTVLNLDLNNAHIYPLYTHLKDKMLDVAVIFLGPEYEILEKKGLIIPQLWSTPLSVLPLRPLSLDFTDVDTRLITYAGYGMQGTFNKAGHVRYSNGKRTLERIASQLFVTPKKNILYDHGCGYDESLEMTKDKIKEIAQNHFFWDREKKHNPPQYFKQNGFPLGAFSPGDSGAPLLYEGRVIGVVATAERPLIRLSAKVFYQFVPPKVRGTWIQWDNWFSDGSFGQRSIRSFAQFFYNMPDTTVNLYQTAAAITPAIYEWMLTKAPISF